MLNFGVTLEKMQALMDRMEACNLREADIQEKFVSSSGPGGQKVNRSATCVCLTHVPSGLHVKMQQSRSQGLNRFYARRRLCELVEGKTLGAAFIEAKKAARVRKQKIRRRRRARKAGDGFGE